MPHLCLCGLCSRGGSKLADLSESLFGIIMDEHSLGRVFCLYCKDIKVEIGADMRLLVSMLISSRLLHYAGELYPS